MSAGTTAPTAHDPEALIAFAERLVADATRAGATEAEAVVIAEASALTRFANSEIHQNVAEENIRSSLRFVLGRRVGVAASGRTDADGLRALVERSAAIARNAVELADWGGLPEPAPVSLLPTAFAEATLEATPELRADGARAVIAAADAEGVLAFGSFATGVEGVAVANSKGIRAAEARTASHLLVVAIGPDGGSGYAEAAATSVEAIDPAAIGREAAAKARAAANPIALAPGDYPVVLEEYAVVDLLDMLGSLGFSALAVQEGRSFFEPGRRIGSQLVTIRDDATNPATLPASFDYEGVPKTPVTLVEKGICRDVVYDAQTAARAGRRSTGHGLPAPNPWGPFPTNMLLEAGAASREELLGGLDRGLLVTRFHYTNPVHPKLAIVTGMTRDGTFLVEDGRIVGPVRNLRYTQSYLDALAGVEAIGREQRTVRGFLGGVAVPAVRIGSWTFTGATE